MSPGPFPLATRLWGVGVIQQHSVTLKLQVHASLIQWTLAYPATTGPDRGQISGIARYVNHHANSVYNISLLALFRVMFILVQTTIIFWPLQASDSRNSGIFGCSCKLLCSMWGHGHWNAQRSRPDNPSSQIFEVRISEDPL